MDFFKNLFERLLIEKVSEEMKTLIDKCSEKEGL